MSRVYDPLGFLGPYTVKAKILMQQIWRENLPWDAPLTPTLSCEWMKWKSDLSLIRELSFPRCVMTSADKKVELHVFADASPQAYGTVAYLRSITCKESRYLISKNRIAPLNKKGKSSLTLPKLELTAALCAARMQEYVLNNLNIEIKNIYLWTDSKITLCWINENASKWKPYIANRVTEIQSLSKGTWRHCPGTDNPADLLTRGVKAKMLLESDLWKYGPSWLTEDENKWPNEEKIESDDLVATFLNITEPQKVNKKAILSIEDYSKLERVLRVTAYVKRFVANLKTPLDKIKGPLITTELKDAENYWIRYTQNLEFEKEIKALQNKESVNSASTILSLNPLIDDDGILRVGGRLQESQLPYDTKHPILLPRKSHYGDLLIWSCHICMAHGGVNVTLAQLRKKFWVIKGRQRIKKILATCVTCKKLNGKAGNENFAPLPKDRITMTNPFKVTGVDFAGPLYVATREDEKSKVYIMLLTCAVVRAVHLELVPDMTTESCVRALRRFIARRGVPDVIYSDNAKTFKRTCMELNKLSEYLKENQVQDIASQLRIEWKFIVERAAWWGGFWERMVKTIKSALKAVLGKALLNYDEMQTILTEVEATVNSRPLTYIDNDPDTLILTPGHFLMGNNDNSLNINMNRTASRDDILKLWSTRGMQMKKFWKVWSLDYLQQLRSAHHINKNSSVKNFKVGDIALLHEQNVPRQLWKMVRIVEVYTGRDGRVRACQIRTSNGTVMKRPIQLLFPLEIDPAGEDVKNFLLQSI